MPDSCLGRTKDGRRCAAKPLPGSQLCPWHDPSWADRRQEWSARGGAARSNASRARRRLPEGILSLDEIRALLGNALKDVLSGKLEPGPANAAAAIARSYLAATEASAVESLQAEVDELRSLIARRGLA
jgi:hypothetical protein